MAVKSKTGISGSRRDIKRAGPKTTSIGQGRRSRPQRRGKKMLRGQGH